MEATGTSTLKVVGILVAMKATVNKNVNFHWLQVFGSSEKATLSTPIADGKHSDSQVVGSSENYRNVSS